MDDLPRPLLAEILSRLSDTAELARCRAVSKSLLAASAETHSLSHLCTLSRYLAARAYDAPNPFKPAFATLARGSAALESVSIAVDKSLGRRSYDEVEDDHDDLYLTDVRFLAEWIPAIGAGLRSLAISDFWSQSSWRKSEALDLISSSCSNLVELEVKNAWLSVDGLSPMPKLKNLTLEFIRLDDEDLNKVNECFLNLQVLNLIGVGGLKDPKIELMHLKVCHWTISNAPTSLTVLAPNLVELKLECVRPRSLVLETPSLSDLHLTLENANDFKVRDLPCLKNLKLVSWNICSLVGMFHSSRNLEMLKLDIPKRNEPVTPKLCFHILFDLFPNIRSLKLGPGAWSEMEALFFIEGLEGIAAMNRLKEITAHLVVNEIDTTRSFISSILDRHTNLSEMGLLIHSEFDSSIASKFISKCRTDWPRIRWKWGLWKEGANDCWVSDTI